MSTKIGISQIAKKYSIKVSKPAGYYPPDVDSTLIKLTERIEDLEKENKKLEEEVKKLIEQKDSLNKQLTEIKLENVNKVATIVMPSTTPDQDREMLNNFGNIGVKKNKRKNNIDIVTYTGKK